MQISFESRHYEAADLRQDASARVRIALRRLAQVVRHAKIQLSDINGPRGGVDKRCQLELTTTQGGSLVVGAVAENWHQALNSCLKKACGKLLKSARRRRRTNLTKSRGAMPAERPPSED